MTATLDRRGRFVLLSSAFVLTGAATVTLGPILPELQDAWSMGAGQISWLFTAQFLGSAIGSVLSTRRLDWSLPAGYLLMGAGLLMLALGGPESAIAAAFLVGFGLGSAIPATNLRIAYDDPENRGAALAKVNLVWGVGAAGLPLLLALVAGKISLRVPVAWIGVVSILVALPLLRTPVPPTPADRFKRGGAAGADSRPETGGRSDFISLLPFAAIFFLYVGTEATFGGWLVSLATEFETSAAKVALLIGSTFWAALLLGRGLAAPLLRRTTESRLYWICLGLAILGTTLVLLVPSISAVWIAAGIVGLGLAPLFPLSVSFMTQHAERLGTDNTGWIFAASGLGGASIPWLVGQIAELSSSTRFGFSTPLICLTLIALFFYFLIDEKSPALLSSQATPHRDDSGN